MKTIIFKSPSGKETIEFTATPFKLESKPRCYKCHTELTEKESKHKAKFKFFDKQGKELGVTEAFFCFNCIEKITGRRTDHE